MSIQVKQRMFDNISPITGKKLPILSQGTNAKTIKSDKLGQYLTGIVYLSPYKLSGKNLCSHATNGCINSCLNTAGRGKMSNVQKGRLRKSLLFLNNQQEYFKQLCADIRKHIIKCEKTGRKPAIRLNGTSDLPYENILYGENQSIFDIFPQVQFYDYTKIPDRITPFNYALTYSHWGKWGTTDKAMEQGQNVAMVFNVKKTEELPKTFNGRSVVDGDKTDLRTPKNDGLNAIVGLRAKMSRANINKELDKTTSFVVRA